jgi:hypothetical protein
MTPSRPSGSRRKLPGGVGVQQPGEHRAGQQEAREQQRGAVALLGVPSLMIRESGTPSIHSVTSTRSVPVTTCGMRISWSPSYAAAKVSCASASRR